MKRGRRALTPEDYKKIVEAYRVEPGNASAASRATGLDRRTCRRGWDIGWKDYPDYVPAKVLFEREAAAKSAKAKAAVAEVLETVDDAREIARREVAEARKEEAQMLTVARKDVLGALVVSAELMPAMRTLAKDVARKLGQGLDKLDPAKALDLLDKHARLTRRAVDATDTIVKLQRLDRGQPGQIIGVSPVDAADEMTLEDALAELEAAGNLVSALRDSTGPKPGETTN